MSELTRSDLDPCPKCRSNDKTIYVNMYLLGYDVSCDQCGHQVHRRLKQDAIKAWNKKSKRAALSGQAGRAGSKTTL